MRRRVWGRTLLWALLAAAMVLSAAGAASSDIMYLSKDGGRRSASAPRVEWKTFHDELPRVSAIEKARARGAVRGGRTLVRLLAIRVEFQPDNDPRSTGDGTFDYSPWDGATFDGPPHDREYFELHMTALENYFESVSYGGLDIEFDVVPAGDTTAYRLPYDMGYYHDYSEDPYWYVDQVERFTRDAFAAADTNDTIDFSQYDGYVLFHAGSDWQSDINYDSPFDLPDAHISLGDSISVNDGAWAIWDAAIMPETSSQDGLSVVMNGTLAHEVGHILGLPDLYNTGNFFPAIGDWGIMDSGGRIGMATPWGYAYGLIPGAPCAWSKEYMGWVDPVVLVDDQEDVEVKASSARGPGYRLFKIPVTETEYFLIENRLDDLGGDNLVAIEQERGVVLGPVDPDCPLPICPVNHEYDFLMPGPGLIIYHIDDTRVIPGLMPYDTVNSDWRRLGVAIEEADGIWDLGNWNSFYWTGNAYDPFYAANNDSFSWDTYPSTANNLGGRTYLSITGISDPDTVMTMDVRFDRWKPGWPVDLGEPVVATPRVADLDGDGLDEIVVAGAEGTIYAWRADGTPVVPLCGTFGEFARVSGAIEMPPALADIDGNGDLEVIVATAAGSLHVWDHVDSNGDGLAEPHGGLWPVAIDGAASCAPLAAELDSRAGLEIAVASRGGSVTVVGADGAHIAASPYVFGHLVLEDISMAAGPLDDDGLDELVFTTTNRGWVVAMDGDGTPVPGWPPLSGIDPASTGRLVLGDLDLAPDGRAEVVLALDDGTIHVLDARGRELTGWPIDAGADVAARPALADLDEDGMLEVLVTSGDSHVRSYRWNGVLVEEWPLTVSPGDSAGVAFTASPLVGDIDGNGVLDVVALSPGGNASAWDGVSGDLLQGWPLSADAGRATPWIGDADDDGELDVLTVGGGGRILFYRMPSSWDVGPFVWPTEGGTPDGRAMYDAELAPVEAPEDGRLLSGERTYCYPNPARGEDLRVRFYLERAADVEVTVLDLTGEVVASFDMAGVRSANEVVWEADGVPGGLYIVRVEAFDPEASSGTGREPVSETKLMKVAVVR
jgi:M6 family metalloprotease-like protein